MNFKYETKLVTLDPETNLPTALNELDAKGFEIFAITPIRHISALIVYRMPIQPSGVLQAKVRKP